MIKITIVLPCFNEENNTLREAISSLIEQEYQRFICIVIDDSNVLSKANYCKYLCETNPRFKYIRTKKRLGLPESLNLGISLANTKYIARFDSDDICKKNRFTLQVKYLEKNKGIGVVGGAIEIIENGKVRYIRKYPLTHNEIARKINYTNSIAHPTVMLRTSIIQKHKGYNPEYKACEDLDIWLRYINEGVKFANLPDVLIKYRQHAARRNNDHQKYNIKARINNLSIKYFLPKVFGILSNIIWGKLPMLLKKIIYKKILFEKIKT